MTTTLTCRYDDCESEFTSDRGRSIHESVKHNYKHTGDWDSREYLREQYVERGKSISEIADENGTNYNVVRNRILEYDIDTRHANETRYHSVKQRFEQNKEEIISLYKSGEPMYMIAEKFGVNDATVKRYLLNWDVETRGISEQHLTERPEPLKNKEWLHTKYREEEKYTPEIAEMLGVSPSCVVSALKDHSIEIWDHGKTVEKEGVVNEYGKGWREAREKRLDKDGWECVVCGLDNHQHKDIHNHSLHVHHIQPVRKFVDEGGDIDYEAAHRITNLVTLCQTCHAKWEGIPLRPQ